LTAELALICEQLCDAYDGQHYKGFNEDVIEAVPEDGVMLPRLLPMLAVPAAPFDSPEYSFELKWDGIRALAAVETASWRLWGRQRGPCHRLLLVSCGSCSNHH
jgi:hypothetical protein